MRLSPRAVLVTLAFLVLLLVPTAALADDGWLDELVDGSTDYAYVDIAVDSNGAPHIVYQETVSNTLRYAWRNGGAWHSEEIDTDSAWASISAAPDGTLHIAFQKTGSIWHTWGSQGAWQTELAIASAGAFCSIDVDSTGEPSVAYSVGSSAYCASRDGSGWHATTLSGGGYGRDRVHLALGPDGQPFVTQSYMFLPTQEEIDRTVRMDWRDGDGWHSDGFFRYDEQAGMPVWDSYGNNYASVAVDPFGMAYIASIREDGFGYEGDGLRLTRRVRDSWGHTVIDSALGSWPDITIDGAYWPVLLDRGQDSGQPILRLITMTNGGATTATTWNVQEPSSGSRQAQALSLDGQSREHIVYVSGGELRYLTRVIPRTLDEVVGPGSPWITNYTPQKGGWMGQDLHPRMLGDVNGDGMDDIVAFGNAATYVSLANGTGFAPQQAWIACYGPMAGGWSSYDLYPRVIGDVNGDGMDDVVAFGNKATYVSLSTGASFGQPAPWILLYGPASGGWTSQDLYPRMLGDVNGDGMDDIVAFGNKATYVSLSTGTSFGGPLPWILLYGPSSGGWSSYDTFPRMIDDVNGDGLDDIVAFGNKATYTSLSTGSAFGPPTPWAVGLGPQAGQWYSQDGQTRLVGDMDGDGATDIVACGQSATYAWRSTTGQLSLYSWFYTIGRGWRSQNIYPRDLGDVNGDGQVDLVGFGSDGVYVQLAP